MGIDPTEDPPIKPGQPTEPPQEDPPGSPQPEIPPPMQDPGEPSQPQELPGSMPDELPVHGPAGPQMPATDISIETSASTFPGSAIAGSDRPPA